ncbi:hypothetical protein EN814_16315 [Mesorhizobium sp. M2D.F.Ca.ET.171.01.1.1]|uniref:hypothetical protein n=1 Tax=unclassified Mesorhizobium TaxID=325217 RepID=UPI001093329F|nr:MULTISPECIES: hypothetical protein [unclassified Mesorhizobium]TGS95266.1 hypothetical protein EN821_16330 [Mesorhizobium sp. M2D.F.Ca.ET.178.01.1.1]TGT10805.1 hypothetical protein EN814_16315 [Mesorhizobium sp. M2D.F.Ca.ET.171.01.1.1]
MNKALAVGFAMAGFINWTWPGFNGFLFQPSNISLGDSRIIGAILMSAAGIIWFLDPSSKS